MRSGKACALSAMLKDRTLPSNTDLWTANWSGFRRLRPNWFALRLTYSSQISTNAALAAKRATSTVPIFFMGVSNPVEVGLVESLARPGGNITGLTNIASVLSGKRLEVLKETIPKLSRVAVLWDPQNPGSAAQWKESEIAAKELRLQIYSTQVSSADKYESAFKAATRAGSMALAVTLSPLAASNQKMVIELAAKNRLPAIYSREDFANNGGLMSYGPTAAADGRDAARLVDKILKGAKPADLPVEQPTKFEFVINLKAAKQIGLTIPPNVLAQSGSSYPMSEQSKIENLKYEGFRRTY